jgi:Ca2+-binding EF-hand superfamily protein
MPLRTTQYCIALIKIVMNVKTKATIFKIHYKEYKAIEEDEIAQITEIFKHFDFGNRGRVATAELPTILRLLQHNIGEDEDKELRFEVDSKSKGFFTLKELVNLLENVSFKADTQTDLTFALSELDTDADGFIEREELAEYLRNVGEPLTEEEMQEFIKIATDVDSDRPTLVNIKRLSDIILPNIAYKTELSTGLKTKN